MSLILICILYSLERLAQKSLSATHPSSVTGRIREGLLCSRDNPCHFCESWDQNAWNNKYIRINKVLSDLESSERKMYSIPIPFYHTMLRPKASLSSAQSKPVAANPLDISQEDQTGHFPVPVVTVLTFGTPHSSHQAENIIS